MDKFDIRLGDYGVKSCDENFLDKNEHTTAVIVKYKEDLSYVIALWMVEGDGVCSLKFVGGRVFGSPPDLFFELAKIGQDLLERIVQP